MIQKLKLLIKSRPPRPPLPSPRPIITQPPIDIYVFGIQRSGHHAIIRWILGQFPHLNIDTDLIKSNIFINDWLKGGVTNCPQTKTNLVCDIPHNDQIRLVSYENNKEVLINENRDLLLKDGNYCFVVLRDPLNWYASMKKLWKIPISDYKIELGIRYFEEFVIKKIDNRVIPIIYDKWFINRQYRDSIAKKLVKTPNDRGFGKMFSYNMIGSSFDNWKYKNDATKMNVLERYKYLSNDEIYELLSNRRIYAMIKYIRDFSGIPMINH